MKKKIDRTVASTVLNIRKVSKQQIEASCRRPTGTKACELGTCMLEWPYGTSHGQDKIDRSLVDHIYFAISVRLTGIVNTLSSTLNSNASTPYNQLEKPEG